MLSGNKESWTDLFRVSVLSLLTPSEGTESSGTVWGPSQPWEGQEAGPRHKIHSHKFRKRLTDPSRRNSCLQGPPGGMPGRDGGWLSVLQDWCPSRALLCTAWIPHMPTFCSSLRKEGISLGLSTLGLDLIPDTSPSWPAPSSCILRYGQGGALPRLPWNHLLVVTRVVYQ